MNKKKKRYYENNGKNLKKTVLTMKEIAKKFGIPVEELKIKK